MLKGWEVPALLDTFEQARLPIIHHMVSKTEAASEALNSASRLTHLLLTHLAPLALSIHLIQQLVTGLLGETALNYRDSALSQTGYAPGRLRAGDRVPHLLMRWHTDSAGEAEPQETPLYALLAPSRFTLLVAGSDYPAHLPVGSSSSSLCKNCCTRTTFRLPWRQRISASLRVPSARGWACGWCAGFVFRLRSGGRQTAAAAGLAFARWLPVADA